MFIKNVFAFQPKVILTLKTDKLSTRNNFNSCLFRQVKINLVRIINEQIIIFGKQNENNAFSYNIL